MLPPVALPIVALQMMALSVVALPIVALQMLALSVVALPMVFAYTQKRGGKMPAPPRFAQIYFFAAETTANSSLVIESPSNSCRSTDQIIFRGHFSTHILHPVHFA